MKIQLWKNGFWSNTINFRSLFFLTQVIFGHQRSDEPDKLENFSWTIEIDLFWPFFLIRNDSSLFRITQNKKIFIIKIMIKINYLFDMSTVLFLFWWFHSRSQSRTGQMSRNGRSSRLYMAEKETKRNGNFRVWFWVRNPIFRSRVRILDMTYFYSQQDTMRNFFSSITKNCKHFAVIYKMIFKYFKAQI